MIDVRWLLFVVILFACNTAASAQDLNRRVEIDIQDAKICKFYSDIMLLTLQISNKGNDTEYFENNLSDVECTIAVNNDTSALLNTDYFSIDNVSFELADYDERDIELKNIHFRTPDSCFSNFLIRNKDLRKMRRKPSTSDTGFHEFIVLAPFETIVLYGSVSTFEFERTRIKNISSKDRKNMNVSLSYNMNFLQNGTIQKVQIKTKPSQKLKSEFVRYYSLEKLYE